MRQFLLYKDIYKWLICGLIGVIIVVFLFYFNHLHRSNAQMKQELYLIKNQLATCQRANAELTQQIELDRQKYQKRIAKLLKKAHKPIKIIEVPKIIEKKVYITNKDCQRMCIMIDRFIEIQREQK